MFHLHSLYTVNPLPIQESFSLQISFRLDEAERLLEIDSVVDEDDAEEDDVGNSAEITKVDATEEEFVRDASHSAQTKTEHEFGI